MVGCWGAFDGSVLAEWFALAVEPAGWPVTFVCDPWGEVIERRGLWTRWIAPSSGKLTRWHLAASLSEKEVFDDELSMKTECGLPVAMREVHEPNYVGYESHDGHEKVVRYGPPPDACRACRMRLLARPPARTVERVRGASSAVASLAFQRGTRSALSVARSFEEMGQAARRLDHQRRQVAAYKALANLR